jgi:lysophospholipase
MKTVISILRRDNPQMPLFVLGESMGGAIALRIGEQIPNEINGLICSVPSGSRYGAKKTALKVAWHFITGRYKPIDIGTQVVSQATSETELREKWIHDPSARMHLSPNELLEFDLFMGQNVEVAKKIDRLPVILFQGDEDRLVKKKGTYDLFEAIKTKQKTLVLLGYTEHLIFEAGQFKDDITLGVIGWMKAHGAN